MDGIIRTTSFRIDRAAYLKAMWSRGLWRRVGIVGALYATMLAGLYAAFGLPAIEGAAPVLVTVLLLLPGIRYLLTRRVVYGTSGSRLYDDARTMEFSVDGFRVQTGGGIDSKVPWDHVERVERRNAFTFLFTSRIMHFIVPDEAFASAGDREAFDILLRGRGLAKT